jgi:hypothetical protein
VNRVNKIVLALSLALLGAAGVAPLRADTVTMTGLITQSVLDGTGPAIDNPDLNQIVDGAFYIVRLNLPNAISAPGTYDLTGSDMFFRVETAGATETGFNSISLSIEQTGSFDNVSLLGCLSTGSGCNLGNELDLNFRIPSASLNAISAQALAIPGLVPFDLLEDDGATDIQGSIANYSYTQTAPAPEPSPLVMMGAGMILTGLAGAWRRLRK